MSNACSLEWLVARKKTLGAETGFAFSSWASNGGAKYAYAARHCISDDGSNNNNNNSNAYRYFDALTDKL